MSIHLFADSSQKDRLLHSHGTRYLMNADTSASSLGLGRVGEMIR